MYVCMYIYSKTVNILKFLMRNANFKTLPTLRAPNRGSLMPLCYLEALILYCFSLIF